MKTYILKRMIAAVILVVLCVFANHVNSETVFEMIVDTITIEDAVIRTEGLAAIKKNAAITDDDYSLLMIKAVEEFKKDEYRFIRGFAMGALMRFGTSNALDYVRNEALHGPDQSGGFEAYALISSFNEETFSMANALYFRDDKISRDRRTSLYSFLCASINSGNEYCGREISSENRRRILAFLHEKMKSEHAHAKYLDEILLRRDPEYGKGEERKRIIASLAESTPTNLPTYAYFQTELAKIKKAEQEAERETAAVDIKETEAQAESKIWLYSLITLAGGLSLAAFLALCKNRKRLS